MADQEGNTENISEPESELQTLFGVYQLAVQAYEDALVNLQEMPLHVREPMLTEHLTAAKTAAGKLKEKWAINETEPLQPKIHADIGTHEELFGDLGKEEEETPSGPLPGEDRIFNNIGEERGEKGRDLVNWMVDMKLHPTMGELEMKILKRLYVNPDYPGRVWPLGEGEVPPSGFVPVFASRAKSYPRWQNGSKSSDFLLLNTEELGAIQGNDNNGPRGVQAVRVAETLRNLLSFKDMQLAEDGFPVNKNWRNYIQHNINNNVIADVGEAYDTIGESIRAVVKTRGPDRGKPDFFLHRDTKEPTSRKIFWNSPRPGQLSTFFQNLIIPYISQDHPNYIMGPEGVSFDLQMSGSGGVRDNSLPQAHHDIMRDKIEESGITNEPIPYSSLKISGRPSLYGGGSIGQHERYIDELNEDGSASMTLEKVTPWERHDHLAHVARLLQARKLQMIYDMVSNNKKFLEDNGVDAGDMEAGGTLPTKIQIIGYQDPVKREGPIWNIDDPTIGPAIVKQYEDLLEAETSPLGQNGANLFARRSIIRPWVQQHLERVVRDDNGEPIIDSPYAGLPYTHWAMDPNHDGITYGDLLSNIAGFIKKLETIYNAGYEARGNFPMQTWDDATHGFVNVVQKRSNVSGATMTETVWNQLKGMGLFDDFDGMDHYNHRINIPSPLIQDEENPDGVLPTSGTEKDADGQDIETQGLFTLHGSTQEEGVMYLATLQQKERFANHFLKLQMDGHPLFQANSKAGQWMHNQTLVDNSPFNSDVIREKLKIPYDDGLTPEQRHRLRELGWSDDQITNAEHDNLMAAIAEGNGPPPKNIREGSASVGDTPPDRIREDKIRQTLLAMFGPAKNPEGSDPTTEAARTATDAHLRRLDPKKLEEYWTEHYDKPLMEMLLAGNKPDIHKPTGDFLVDGEIKAENIEKIKTAYKELHSQDVPDHQISGKSNIELQTYHSSLQDDVTKRRQEKFLEEANDISGFQPLEPNASTTDIMQQYRKLWYHGKKYGAVMDKKDTAKGPSPHRFLRQLFDQLVDLGAAKGITKDAFQADVDSYEEAYQQDLAAVQAEREKEADKIRDEVLKDDTLGAPYERMAIAHSEELLPLPPLYGSLDHLEQAARLANEASTRIGEARDFLDTPNEGGALQAYLREENIGANEFRNRDEEGNVNAWNFAQPGSRMTYHKGPNKGQLVTNPEAYEGLEMSQNETPNFTYPDFPNKVFGLPQPVEQAYIKAYQGTASLKQLAVLYGKVWNDLNEAGLIHQFAPAESEWDQEFGNQIPNPIFPNWQVHQGRAMGAPYQQDVATLTTYLEDILGNPSLLRELISGLQIQMEGAPPEEVISRLQKDREMFRLLAPQVAEAEAVLQKAKNDEIISDDTLTTLMESIGYSDNQARIDMKEGGHNEWGLPIDVNAIDPETRGMGLEEKAPMYMGNDGELHPRVYHRPTKMWFNPELLDDIRNSQGLGAYINNPWDSISVAGMGLGTDGNDTPIFLLQPDPDIYRLAVPAVNNTEFFNEGTKEPTDTYHGIYISRTGVQQIGDVQGDAPGLIDGELVNHGGPEGTTPLTAGEIAQRAFSVKRGKSELENPALYVDENGNLANHISVDQDGHFAGGWKEWLQNPITSIYEAPGIRSIPGMRRVNEMISGKPYQRLGAYDPKMTQGLFSGPMTNAGDQMTSAIRTEIDRRGTPQEVRSRVQNLRQYGTPYPPETGPRSTKLQRFVNSINRSLGFKNKEKNQRRLPMFGNRVEATMQDLAAGVTGQQLIRDEVYENLRQYGQTLETPENIEDFINRATEVEQNVGNPLQRQTNLDRLQGRVNEDQQNTGSTNPLNPNLPV